jgi:hypothetical protein
MVRSTKTIELQRSRPGGGAFSDSSSAASRSGTLYLSDWSSPWRSVLRFLSYGYEEYFPLAGGGLFLAFTVPAAPWGNLAPTKGEAIAGTEGVAVTPGR